MRFFALILPVAFLFSARNVRGEDLPPSVVYTLLLKVARAPSVVAYDGILTIAFQHGNRSHTVTLSIQHTPGQADRLKVVPAGYLPPPEHPSRGGHWEPDRSPLRFMGFPGMRERLNNDLALLLRNYTFAATDGGRIAGRSTYRLKIAPKYPGRVEKVLWVDNRTGVVLKSQVTHPYADSTVTISFTTISESPTDWTLPASVTDGFKGGFPKPLQERGAMKSASPWVGAVDQGDIAKLQGLGKSVSFPLLAPAYIPQGFVIEEVREIAPQSASASPVVHVLYSDGLSSISLFLQKEEPLWPDRIRSFFFGGGHHGTLFHRERPPVGVTVVEGNRDGTRYVLVSDISGSQINRMADSLAPVGAR